MVLLAAVKIPTEVGVENLAKRVWNMGSWPFTRLHFGCRRCIAISGPYIQVFDATSGQILATTRCTTTISCSVVDSEYINLVTTGDDKKLNVWDMNGLQLKSSRELPKKATAVKLSHNGQTIIVADKFGDVFSYPIDPPNDSSVIPCHSSEPRRNDAQAAHENPHGSLVLGHASIITSFLLSHDGRYIITADRDEHIRVSHYPHGYNIERFCLGHKLFISAICLPVFESSSLVSGGGDPYLNVWDWMSGRLKCQLPVADAVKPFLKVRENRNKWYGGQGTSSGARGRKGRNKAKNAKESTGEVTMKTAEESPKLSGETVAENKSEEDLVFALAKVEAFEFIDERLLVFSAIGGSAVFYCAYPSQTSNIPSVRHIDFSSPVLDFVLGDGCQLLVSVDAARSLPLTHEGTVGTAVRLIEWVDGEFKIADDTTLLNSLNGAGLQDASAAELTSLNLYSDLALLPKHADGPEEGDGSGYQESDMRADTPELSQSDRKKQHAKVVGRMKTKQALLKRQELDKGSSRSASGDEREQKKIKLDQSE